MLSGYDAMLFSKIWILLFSKIWILACRLQLVGYCSLSKMTQARPSRRLNWYPVSSELTTAQLVVAVSNAAEACVSRYSLIWLNIPPVHDHGLGSHINLQLTHRAVIQIWVLLTRPNPCHRKQGNPVPCPVCQQTCCWHCCRQTISIIADVLDRLLCALLASAVRRLGGTMLHALLKTLLTRSCRHELTNFSSTALQGTKTAVKT